MPVFINPSVVSWLQSGFVAPAAATIRIAVTAGSNLDWSIAAGDRWASLDALCADWTAALGGGATVAVVGDGQFHRGKVAVTTATGATYTLSWSHAGDGTTLRDRLGVSGDIPLTASGATWSGYVVGAFYSWVGFSLEAGKASLPGAAARMVDGTVVTQHGRDGAAEPLELEAVIRWGIPPNALRRWYGYQAFETFLRDLYETTSTPSDTFAIYHEPTNERWLVRFASDRVVLRPTAVPQSLPYGLYELSLTLDVVERPS